MDKPRPPAMKSCLLALIFLVLFAAGGTADAVLFVYEKTDGSSLVTDHAMNDKHWRLVAVRGEVRRARRLTATEHSARFREGPSTYDRLIKHSADEYGVNFALVKAIMHAESSFDPNATSNKGAIGLMQVLPATAKFYGAHDIYDPGENIRVAVQHLRYLFEAFDNDYYLVIAAYNAGEDAVKKHRGLPPYEETQSYVQKVLHYTYEYGLRS